MIEKHISVSANLHERVKKVAAADKRSMRKWVEKKVEEDEAKQKDK